MRQQISVALGMMAAAIVVALLFWGPELTWAGRPIGDDVASRLVWAIRLSLLPAVCILAAVGVIATRRFFDPRAIGGGLPEPGSALDIDRRVLANTVEQAMLALPAYAAAAVTLPMEDMPRIGACAMAFVAGRIAFAIGYHIAPPFRAFGFALTFYSSAALYAWLAWELVIPH